MIPLSLPVLLSLRDLLVNVKKTDQIFCLQIIFGNTTQHSINWFVFVMKRNEREFQTNFPSSGFQHFFLSLQLMCVFFSLHQQCSLMISLTYQIMYFNQNKRLKAKSTNKSSGSHLDAKYEVVSFELHKRFSREQILEALTNKNSGTDFGG